MAMQNHGAPGFTFAGFLILAALGSFIWSTNDPTSSRPTSTADLDASKLKEGDIPARLWQDPYRALERYLEKNKSDRNETPYLFPQDNNDQSSKDSSLRYRIEKQTNKNNLTVLGVMVDTDPFAESEERRRQRRYAVVSALGESNYVPDNEKLIHSVRIKDSRKNDMTLPYEWYTYDSDLENKPCILVIWLDEARFSKSPWGEFSNIVEKFIVGTTKSENINFKILGPASSTTLKKMYKACPESKVTSACIKQQILKNTEQRRIGGFHFLSPIATMADDLLGIKKDTLLNVAYEAKFSFLRTIRTDDILAGLLVDELATRKIPSGLNTNASNTLKKGTVVLISEWDTSFGRSLPKSFMQKFCNDKNRCERVIQYSYLRGLDGKTAGNKDLGLTTSSDNNKQSGNSANNSDFKKIRRPVGTGQYDYLQRLAAELRNIDRKRYMQYGKGIVAIGILGSDVHDKLLVLKILRSKLPSAVTFTTDLDSQLLHPSDFDWTRNVIVASSFGLRLNEKLQTKTPAFRNNYQTSLFFSSLLAVKYKCPGVDCDVFDLSQEKLNKLLIPTIAEIGRYGAVVLNKNELKQAELLTLDSKEIPLSVVYLEHFVPNSSKQAYLIVFISLMIIIAWTHLNHKWKETSVWLLISLVIFSLLTVVAVCINDDEPFSFSNGTSAWPALYVRVLAILLTVFFIMRSMKRLTDNSETLAKKYIDGSEVNIKWPSNRDKCLSRLKEDNVGGFNSVCLHVCAPISLYARKLGKFLETKNSYKYIFLGILFVVLSILIMSFGRGQSTVSDIKYLVIVGVVAISVWCGVATFSFDMRWINVWINSRDSNRNGIMEIKINQLWAEYKGYGEFFHRMLRALCNVVFYLVIAASVFLLLGTSPAPVRGNVIGIIMIPITLISVIGMLFMIFFVVDTTRLCIAWITALTENKILWNKSKIEEMNHELNLKDDATLLWIKMHMIAERTQVVGELIYFPFIIIILMLFSRISFFDHWGFPQALAIVITVNIIIATSNAFRLRNVAEQARAKILEQLNTCYIHTQGHNIEQDYPPANQIKAMIENIQGIREGAYKPFLEQPVVRGFILLLGGIGFSISQYSNAFN